MEEVTIMNTYEEKYKEALGWIKNVYPTFEGAVKEDAEHFFPELKESEDERIRKALIKAISRTHKGNKLFGTDVTREEALAWLEKQGSQILDNSAKTCEDEQKPFDYENANIQKKDFAQKADIPHYSIGDVLCDKSCTTLGKEEQSNFEITDIRNGMYICDKCSFPISQQDEYELVAKRIEQKPADNVEAKFKVGDWIIYDRHISKVKDMDSEGYLVEDNYGDEGVPPKEFAEKYYHLWTIVDAKDGDVIATEPIDGYPSSFVAIFKKPDEEDFDSYCFVGFDGIFYEGEEGHSTENIHPATKEQCLLLFQKMKEAGYEWNAEKKEVKKISQRIISAEAKEAMYDKPAWSEEDEEHYNACLNYFEEIKPDSVYYKDYLWLKSLKQRINV